MEKHFCPRCGSKLETRCLEDRERGFCPACRVVHYENPVPATAVVVFNERNELLLVRRAVEPGKGKWCLPGGFQEMGETPEQCALRELKEETGLDGRVQELIALEMGLNPSAGRCWSPATASPACGGELQAGDDAMAAAYFPLDGLPELAFQSHARIIEQGRRVAAGRGGASATCPAAPTSSPAATTCAIAREACRGGARIVQYRDKDAPAARRLETARRIRAVTRESGTLFIVNDQLDIAVLSEADGVHIGQDDIPIAAARSLLPPGMIVGVSCSSLAEALAAERQGADYLGVGAVFATPVKEGYPLVGLDGLRRIAAEVALPIVAIGGINLENMAAVKAAGAKYPAMVREFQQETAARVAAVNELYSR